MSDEEKPPEEPKKEERVSPTRQRQDAQREKSQAEFDRQVEEGSVTIRQMTPAERKANPAKERPPKKPRK